MARPARSFKLGSKLDWLYPRAIIIPVIKFFTYIFQHMRYRLPDLLSCSEQLLYIYIYIYICVCVCVCVCVYIFVQNFFINAYFIKQYSHLLSTHFGICPFELPHWFYGIWRDLVNETHISTWYPNTFCSILGRYQVGVYCKGDVTFVCILLLFKCLSFIISTFNITKIYVCRRYTYSR